jgi:hypothetical protein
MIPHELKQITETDLQTLIEKPVMEIDRLEFKATWSLETDEPSSICVRGKGAKSLSFGAGSCGWRNWQTRQT